MLVLTRHKDESIMVGDDVEITIVDIRGDQVRLGIRAPRSLDVHRKEVYEAIQREKEEAWVKELDREIELDVEAKQPEKHVMDSTKGPRANCVKCQQSLDRSQWDKSCEGW